MASEITRIAFGVNCYLVGDEGGYVLVDTGIPQGRRRLQARLAAAGCRPDNLRLIVLTHGDVDHAGNCAHLRAISGCPIAVHRDEADSVRSGDPGSVRTDKPDSIPMAFRAVLWAMGLKKGPAFETFEPDVLVGDGDDLSAYGLDARVLLLPGHTRGSIGILTSDGDLFCGDLLMNFRRPKLHFYIDDTAQARQSVDRLHGLGVRTVYPGHGKPFALSALAPR